MGGAARDCQDRNRVIEMTVERDDGGDICRIFPGRWVGESRGRNSSFSQARPPSRSGIAARLLLPRGSPGRPPRAPACPAAGAATASSTWRRWRSRTPPTPPWPSRWRPPCLSATCRGARRKEESERFYVCDRGVVLVGRYCFLSVKTSL